MKRLKLNIAELFADFSVILYKNAAKYRGFSTKFVLFDEKSANVLSIKGF